MDKLLPRLVLIVTASISVSGPATAESRLAGPSPSTFMTGPGTTAIVLAAGMGGGTTGGMGGGTTGGMGGSTTGGMGGSTTGGMGSGSTTGGMGGGSTTGGMGGGSATGGIGGGSTTGGMGWGTGGGWGGFGDMTSPAAGGFGTAGGSPSWNGSQPAYYTYQCVTPSGQCSFTAPAALRSSSLQAGARCSCAVGQSEGRVR
jgi:hypothetical protein